MHVCEASFHRKLCSARCVSARDFCYSYGVTVEFVTSGMGALSPGILRLGYEGGGPYRCMATSHGGGNFTLPCTKVETKIQSNPS